MPVYRFQVTEGETESEFDEGCELLNIEAAKHEAVRFAGAMISERASRFWHDRHWELVVTDTEGLKLFTLTLTGAVDASATPPRLQS